MSLEKVVSDCRFCARRFSFSLVRSATLSSCCRFRARRSSTTLLRSASSFLCSSPWLSMFLLCGCSSTMQTSVASSARRKQRSSCAIDREIRSMVPRSILTPSERCGGLPLTCRYLHPVLSGTTIRICPLVPCVQERGQDAVCVAD